jgi:hypothetical protein
MFHPWFGFDDKVLGKGSLKAIAFPSYMRVYVMFCLLGTCSLGENLYIDG